MDWCVQGERRIMLLNCGIRNVQHYAVYAKRVLISSMPEGFCCTLEPLYCCIQSNGHTLEICNSHARTFSSRLKAFGGNDILPNVNGSAYRTTSAANLLAVPQTSFLVIFLKKDFLITTIEQ